MSISHQHRLQRIEDCRNIFLKYNGQHHELIEKEMRELGHTDFHRRSLYRRFERGSCKAGWIERYGWQRLSMNWEWRHQVYIYKHLKRVTDGLCKRLMIFLPPRHGKSELVTVRYAAWRLKKDPGLNVIIGSYNQRLANRFSRKIRRVLADDQRSEPPASAGGTAVASVRHKAEQDTNHTFRPPANAGGSDSAARTCSLCGYSCPTTPGETSPPAPPLPASPSRQSPFPFTEQRRANSEAEWETSEGGGLRAVGVGSGVTGFGAGLIIIDDPIKSRAEAESQTFRDNLHDWFNDDLYTRLEPGGSIILIQTRWHEDDLAGRLLREAQEEGGEQWEVVNLPALAEGDTERARRRDAETQGLSDMSVPGAIATGDRSPDTAPLPASLRLPVAASPLPAADPLERAPGEALCPQRYDRDALEKLRRKLGSYSFASLYQQRPVPAEGGLFKRDWFKNIVHAAPERLRWSRGYDLAVSNAATADYTASFRVAYDKEGNLYIDGGFRRRIEYPEQRRYILGRIEAERDTDHGIELSANGSAVLQDLRRERRARGHAFRGVKVTGTKVSRALPWIALAEEGKVFLVRGAWNKEFIDEACSFPAGTHDDQIDAVSIAVSLRRAQSRRLYFF